MIFQSLAPQQRSRLPPRLTSNLDKERNVLNSAIRVTRSEDGALTSCEVVRSLAKAARAAEQVGRPQFQLGLQMERNLEKAQRSLMMQ